jgi:ferrochelatase
MKRLAVVVFNLGGPDQPSSVEPFLFNLFKDKAIINLPGVFRIPLAKFISWRRGPVAREIYQNIGGCSPLLEETTAQVISLRKKIVHLADEVQVFIAMRYWHPLSKSTAQAVKNFDADKIILLPLYPQFSSTTTGSSFNDWKVSAKSVKLKKPTYSVCCYPYEDGYIKGQEFLIRSAIVEAELKMAKGEHVRVLFSAHGLPKKIIKGGDPYQWQIEQTAMAVANALKKSLSRPNLDWSVCYQSRVGPLEWIDPSLDQELIRAGQDDKGVVVVPIAFVSEHSETLVELDIEYREKAVELNIPVYVRVPALSIEENFINSLAKIVEASVNSSDVIRCQAGERQCPAKFTNCPL